MPVIEQSRQQGATPSCLEYFNDTHERDKSHHRLDEANLSREAVFSYTCHSIRSSFCRLQRTLHTHRVYRQTSHPHLHPSPHPACELELGHFKQKLRRHLASAVLSTAHSLPFWSGGRGGRGIRKSVQSHGTAVSHSLHCALGAAYSTRELLASFLAMAQIRMPKIITTRLYRIFLLCRFIFPRFPIPLIA